MTGSIADNSDTLIYPSYNLIDLFAGVGGLTFGFCEQWPQRKANFVPRLMVDNEPEARNVAVQNFPRTPYSVEDVHRLSGSTLRERANMRPDEPVHVLVGGPPCQGFSLLGRRALEDERNALLVDFIRMVEELRPLVAVLENVPSIISSHDGEVIREVCDSLAALGYMCCADILLASHYGVPQLRKRAITLAYRSDLGIPPQFPLRTHERISTAAALIQNGLNKARFEPDKLPYISVEDAIGDLEGLAAGEGAEASSYPRPPRSEYQQWSRVGSIALFNHRSRAHSEAFLKKIALIEEGGRNFELPPEDRFSDNYYSQAYARLHRHGIAQTVTTSFSNPGSGRFMHYSDLRSITVREAARLQSFPDRFIFDGHHSTQMRHVGNAVPPLLARAIRDQIERDFLEAGVDQRRSPRRPKKKPSRESPEQRSRVMRAVPNQNTSAEIALRKALSASGLRGYRLHAKGLPGTPDIVFRRPMVAVFVDGCFWHGCPKCHREPQSNQVYWKMKIERNRARDALVSQECRALGWRVVRLWEHEVLKDPEHAIAKVRGAVSGAPERRNPGDLTPSDWRMAILAIVGPEPVEHEVVVRAAASWAREHLGLQYSRIPRGGRIDQGLRSAIKSAIGCGELERVGPRQIQKS
jgi:DNA (cytosine-5)-methyltransferase 1